MPEIGFASRTYQDYDGERSNFGVYCAVLSAANFVAENTDMVALWAAADAITLGGLIKHEHGNRYRDANPVLPASDAAQRELKWLVQYHDSTSGKHYSIEVPCADTAQLDPNDRKHAFIGDAGVVDAFVTAFEAFALSETGGAVVVDEITLVGWRV